MFMLTPCVVGLTSAVTTPTILSSVKAFMAEELIAAISLALERGQLLLPQFDGSHVISRGSSFPSRPDLIDLHSETPFNC